MAGGTREQTQVTVICVWIRHVMGSMQGLPRRLSGQNNPPANAEDTGDEDSIPGSGSSPGGGHGNPLQYSCLEKPTDRGAWQATVYGVTKSRTQPSN